MKRKRASKALSLLLTLCMVLGLLPGMAISASAEEGAHDHSQGWTELTVNGGYPKSGNYYLSDDLTLSSNLIINGQNVTICLNGHVLTGKSNDYSVIQVKNGGTLTICDCQNTKHEGYIDKDGLWKAGETVPEGCTEYDLTGGVITGGNPGTNGQGGAVNIDSGTVTFTGGNIAGNTASYGGGVYNKGTLNLNGGNIVGNKAVYQGGGVSSVGGTFTMTGGAISYNTTDSGNNGNMGGGVYSESSFTMSGGTISHNYVNGTGGGVYISYGKQTSIANAAITYNTASKLAAGVYCNTINFELSGTVTISENKIHLGTESRSNLYLNQSSSNNVILSVTNALNTDSHIGISGSDVYHFAQGSQNLDLKPWKDSFFADDPAKMVAVEVGGSYSYLKLMTNPYPYTVTFNANGGDGTMESQNIAAGKYTLPECGFTAPKGKLFAGWALSAEGQVISTYTVDKDFTLYAIWRESDPVSIRNGGYPYLQKIVNGQMILAMDAAGDGVTYQWQSATSKDGPFSDINGATESTYTFYPNSGKWYRCMVSDKPSKAVMAVKSTSSTWTTTETKWYLSNGTMAYTTDGKSFDVVGLYQKNSKDYMMSVSNGGWEMYSNTATEPSAGNLATANLDALKVSFSETDAHVLNFEADLKDGHQAFALGCDTKLGNFTTSSTYCNTGALKAVVKDGKLSQIAMVGAKAFADAKDTDPAFVIKPLDPAASRFWIGDKSGRETYAYNTSGGDATEAVGGQQAVTLVKNTDSGMTMSWMNVPSGGSVKFQFSVGSVKDTGVDRGEEGVGSVTAVTVTPNKEVSVNKGAQKQFTATVIGTGSYDQTVTWSIQNAQREGTTISESGLLTVATDETASSISVIATSKGDSTKSCTVPVNIPQATSVSLSQTYWYPTAVGEKLTLTATIPASYDSARWVDQEGYIELAAGTDAYKGGTDTHIDTTVTVELKQPCWGMIQISAGPNGGIQQSATCYVKAGHRITIDPDSDGNGLEYDYTFNNPYTLPSIEDYSFTVPDGKRFKAWSVNGAEYPAGQPVTIPVSEDETYGSLTITAIWEEIPVTTYTVTYNSNGGSAVGSATVSAGGKLTAPEAPTKGGYTFHGWYKDAAFTNRWNFGADTVTGNITLYAKWAETAKTYGISGTVYAYDGATASGVTVKLMKGDTQVALTTSAAGGTYSFTGIAPGVYNIVAEKDSVTQTTLVVVKDQNETGKDITMPNGTVNSKLTVSGADTPDVVAGGLDKEAAAVKADNSGATSVKVEMTVESKRSEAVAPADRMSIETSASGKTLEYLDIKVTKTVVDAASATTTTAITTTANMMEIIIPYDMTGKNNITVYRYHDGVTKAFAENTTKADGTFYLDTANHLIYVYTQKFSTYAIGYTVPSPGGSGGSSSGSGSSSSSGGSSSGNSSTISAPSAKNGTVSVSPKSASKGTTVTVTVTPDDGYELDKLSVKDKNGKEIAITAKGNGKYTFTMPAGTVTVEATFKSAEWNIGYVGCPKDNTCPIWPYTDAKTTDWYHDGVHFCLENGLMVGYGDNIFKPNAHTTRSMLIVMLWRLNGSPVVNYALDFADVKEGTWYTEAVRWAKSEGVAGGYGNGKFGPDDTLTREQMVMMLYRYARYKGCDVSVGEDTNILSFGDATTVAEYAIPAMQWACGSGVVGGKDATDGSGLILDPKGSTTRAELATMVMRCCAEIVK